ncbi:hypothetical protein BH24ACT22_BH24ACT22_18710 [soil metagenome]
MPVPGEIPQEIGRAYASVLTGCLEQTLPYFQQQFDVSSAPEKVSFSLESVNYSFDARGMYYHPERHREILIEAKGYKKDSGLLNEYRVFIARAYATLSLAIQHSEDLFCFVTNVPFGSTFGRELTSANFISEALMDQSNTKVADIVKHVSIDRDRIETLSERLSLAIFTDSYIRWMGVKYLVKEGDNIWTIMSFLHANQDLGSFYTPLSTRIATMNDLPSANLIFPGQRLHMPWQGIEWVEAEREG